MGKEIIPDDILDLLVRRGVNPNRQPMRRVLDPSKMGGNFNIVGEGRTVSGARPNFTLGTGQSPKYTNTYVRYQLTPYKDAVLAPKYDPFAIEAQLGNNELFYGYDANNFNKTANKAKASAKTSSKIDSSFNDFAKKAGKTTSQTNTDDILKTLYKDGVKTNFTDQINKQNKFEQMAGKVSKGAGNVNKYVSGSTAKGIKGAGAFGGALLGRGLMGLGAIYDAQTGINDIKSGNTAAGVGKLGTAGLGAYATLAPAEAAAGPVGWGMLGGSLLPWLVYGMPKNAITNQKYGATDIDNKILRNIKSGKDPMNGISTEELVTYAAQQNAINQKRGNWRKMLTASMTPEQQQDILKKIAKQKADEKANQLPSYLQDYTPIADRDIMSGMPVLDGGKVVYDVGNNGNYMTPPPVDTQGLHSDKMTNVINQKVAENGIEATGGTTIPAQNTNVQPEASTMAPVETLPQNEQSTSGVDLSSLIGQPNAATQEYIDKILEFAKNYQQNAINDRRKNLALAMIAKGTHNPYLMQAGQTDTNSLAAKQIELIKMAYEAQNKPLEQARLAYAFQAAGMNPAFAYLPTQALSAYASMHGSDLSYLGKMNQIAANKELAVYKTASDLYKLKQEYSLKEALKQLEYRYRTSGEYVKANVVANAARSFTDPMQLAKLFDEYDIQLSDIGSIPGQVSGTTDRHYEDNPELNGEE